MPIKFEKWGISLGILEISFIWWTAFHEFMKNVFWTWLFLTFPETSCHCFIHRISTAIRWSSKNRSMAGCSLRLPRQRLCHPSHHPSSSIHPASLYAVLLTSSSRVMRLLHNLMLSLTTKVKFESHFANLWRDCYKSGRWLYFLNFQFHLIDGI